MSRIAHPRNDKFVTGATAFAMCIVAAAICTGSTTTEYAAYASTLRIDSGLTITARPISVAVDHATGEVCVTDAAGTAFHVLDDRDVLRFVTGGIAALSTPVDGAVDADGGIVFLDTGADHHATIKRLDLRGEPMPYAAESPVAGWRPDHLTLTTDGRIVTIDTSNRILACHRLATGALLWSRPLRIEDPDNAACGRPAVAPDGRIYVPGGDQRVVFVVTADGRADGAFGRFGTGPGRMILPAGAPPRGPTAPSWCSIACARRSSSSARTASSRASSAPSARVPASSTIRPRWSRLPAARSTWPRASWAACRFSASSSPQTGCGIVRRQRRRQERGSHRPRPSRP